MEIKSQTTPLLTIFTPTYNRRELLGRAYESLIRQTRKDFVWLIADDGSQDGTSELVKTWQAEGLLTIDYHYTENGGKMRAHNLGVKLAKTPLFLCLDSDDCLTEDAVEVILEQYDIASGAENETALLYTGKAFGGLVAHKGRDENTPLYGEDFPKCSYSTLYGLYLKGFSGETTLVYKTGILKKYPFPEIPGEKYVPEDYIYDKIDRNYVLKVVPQVLTVCELTDSGYTDSLKRLKRDNPVGWYLYYRQRLKITPLNDPQFLKFKYAGYYLIYRSRAVRSLKKGLRQAPGKGCNVPEKSCNAPGKDCNAPGKSCNPPGKSLYRKEDIPFLWILLGIPAALLLKLTGRE